MQPESETCKIIPVKNKQRSGRPAELMTFSDHVPFADSWIVDGPMAMHWGLGLPRKCRGLDENASNLLGLHLKECILRSSLSANRCHISDKLMNDDSTLFFVASIEKVRSN